MLSLKKLKAQKEQTAVLRDVGETIQRITVVQRARIEEQKDAVSRFRQSLLNFAGDELPLEIIRPQPKIQESLLLVVGPERGLVGDLHREIAGALTGRLHPTPYTLNPVLVAGSRLCGFLESTSNLKFEKYQALSDRPQKEELRGHARFILDGRRAQKWNSVEVLYPQFVSITEFQVATKTLLPLEVRRKSHSTLYALRPTPSPLFFIEPSLEAIIRQLEVMIFETELYEVFLEARLVELSQRLLASTRTAENAKRILKTLQRQYLRVQRSRTTKTINEIFTGRKAFEVKKARGAGVALEWVV